MVRRMENGGITIDETQALTMYKLGLGNMGRVAPGEGKPDAERWRAIKGDWELHRMPWARSHFDFGVELTNEEFEELAWGARPRGDGGPLVHVLRRGAFCFHRS